MMDIFLVLFFLTVPDNLAIRALAGEAGGQSMTELYAHACALKNRGDLGGVYGIRRATTALEQKRALKAWKRAKKGVDIVNGSDHWLSDYDLKNSPAKLTSWRHKAVYSVKVGETTFYKLKKGKTK